MPVWAIVAAKVYTAGLASSQVHPVATRFNAFSASFGITYLYGCNVVYVKTIFTVVRHTHQK